jgi:hypothetical protein
MIEKIFWAIPNRIITVRYAQALTHADIEIVIAEVNNMLNIAQPRTIYLIFDATKVTEYNKEMNIPKAKRYAQSLLLHPNLAWVLFITPFDQHPPLSVIADVVTQLLRLRVKRVSTLDDAILFLMQKDPSLFAQWDDKHSDDKRTMVTFS